MSRVYIYSMMNVIGLVAVLSLPVAAESWNVEAREISDAAAQSVRQAKAARLKSLASKALVQAEQLRAQYQKDSIAARLKLDRQGYGQTVTMVFDAIAEPDPETSGFGLQTGPHLTPSGSLKLVGPGLGRAIHGDSGGFLTEAVADATALVANPRLNADGVLADLRAASAILTKHLDKLKSYSAETAEEEAWKTKTVPVWTELLATIDEAFSLADALRQR